MAEVVAQIQAFLKAGGLTLAALLGVGVVMWFVIVLRALGLRRGWAGGVDALVTTPVDALGGGVVPQAARRARERLATAPEAAEAIVRASLAPARRALGSGARPLQIIVVAAPLLGLLGTVVGMVETFDAFATLPRAQQGQGIARGISRALITTEVGLFHAIPGTLAARWLAAQAHARADELDALRDALLHPREVEP